MRVSTSPNGRKANRIFHHWIAEAVELRKLDSERLEQMLFSRQAGISQ